MRKVVMLNRISLDGYFAGSNGEMDWFIHEPDVDKAAHEMIQADTLLAGRVTYQMFEAYWPKAAADPNAPREARATGDELNQMTKVVVSKTLKEVTWENSRLIKGDLINEVKKLKQGSGPGILILGSGTVVQQLTDEKLIDEYVMILSPVVVGKGKPLFPDVSQLKLKLLEARTFPSGNVVLHFVVDK